MRNTIFVTVATVAPFLTTTQAAAQIEDDSRTGEWYPGWEGVERPRDLVVVSDMIINVQTGTGNRIEFWNRIRTAFKSKGKIRRFIDVGRLTKSR